MTTQTTSTILDNAIASSQELLTQYALSEQLLGDLSVAFGSGYDSDAAQELITQWQTGEFSSFPEFEIRSAEEINGANGAYSADTNKIYISEEYLQANADDVKAVSDLILEEYGHFVDASINSVDAAGDEGAIFSGLVRGESFSDSELQQLQQENDKAVITLDGQEIAIEQQAEISFSEAQRALNNFSVNNGGFTSFDQLPRQVADVNGDGNADIIGFGFNSVFTALSKGDGTFENPQRALNNNFTVNEGGWTSFDQLPRQVADINGDGTADIIGFGTNSVFTSLSESNLIRGTENDDTLTAPDDDSFFIEGLAGNDTLNGGAGTNVLIGGAGNDTFIIEPDGLQIIQDFERGTDKIDITASEATEIRLAPNGEHTNVVNQSNEVLATVEGQIISTEDLTLVSESEQQSLFPELDVSEQNITQLIKAWGDEFAQQQGSSIAGDIDMSRVNFVLNDIDFAQSIEIPSSGTSFNSQFRNTTGTVASQTVETNNETTLETTITTENQTSLGETQGVSTNEEFSISNTVTTSASASFAGFGGSVENSFSISASFGISKNLEKTFEEVLTKSESETESQTSGITETNKININPQSVLYNDIVTLTGTNDVPITMSYSVSGDFRFTLENGENFSVPINAILQHYDLQDGQLDTFQVPETASLKGTDFDGNGTSLFFADTLKFEQAGSLEMRSNFSQTTVSTVTDVLLNGSLVNGNSVGGLEIVRDEFGAPVQVRYNANAESERLWIVKDSLTSNMQEDIINGFTPGNDLFGISHPQIDSMEDISISYGSGNADIHFGEQHLARINGVDNNSLDSSDFVFSTAGTVFDESIQSV